MCDNLFRFFFLSLSVYFLKCIFGVCYWLRIRVYEFYNLFDYGFCDYFIRMLIQKLRLCAHSVCYFSTRKHLNLHTQTNTHTHTWLNTFFYSQIHKDTEWMSETIFICLFFYSYVVSIWIYSFSISKEKYICLWFSCWLF